MKEYIILALLLVSVAVAAEKPKNAYLDGNITITGKQVNYSGNVTLYNVDYIYSKNLVQFRPYTQFRVYPNNQATYGVQLSTSSANGTISVMGGNMMIADDNWTFQYRVNIDSLKGAGNAYVCTTSTGQLYRSGVACV